MVNEERKENFVMCDISYISCYFKTKFHLYAPHVHIQFESHIYDGSFLKFGIFLNASFPLLITHTHSRMIRKRRFCIEIAYAFSVNVDGVTGFYRCFSWSRFLCSLNKWIRFMHRIRCHGSESCDIFNSFGCLSFSVGKMTIWNWKTIRL